MEQVIFDILDESVRVKQTSVRQNAGTIAECAEKIADALRSGNKLMIFGNGGSAADAQHLAAEFVNRFRIERPPLAAIALTTDTSVITSISNDYRFEDIFAKQVLALGRPGDIAWGIRRLFRDNVLEALQAAKKIGMFTVGFTGKGGRLVSCSDLVFTVDSNVTADPIFM